MRTVPLLLLGHVLSSVRSELADGYAEATIHPEPHGASKWLHVDRGLHPCVAASQLADPAYVTVNHFGCDAHNDEHKTHVVWVVPVRGVGPIRLAGELDAFGWWRAYGCIDATKAIEFMNHEAYKRVCSPQNCTALCGGCRTFPAQAEIETATRRLVELRPCDGSLGQQFRSVSYNRYGLHSFYSASNSSYFLAAEGASLALSTQFSHVSGGEYVTERMFGLVEYREPSYSTVDCHVRECFRIVISMLLSVYVVSSAKALPQWIRTLPSLCRKRLAYCRRKTAGTVQKSVAQRRLRRAQYVTKYIVHVIGIWLAGYVWSFLYSREHGVWYPWHARSAWRNTANCRDALYDSELVPAVSVACLCLLLQAKVLQTNVTLDVFTILAAIMWSFKYYALSQGTGFSSLDHYLYNESWMLVARVCLNAVVGRAPVAIPCNILVTCVDVYCLTSLTAMHVQMSYHVRFQFYAAKQGVLCLMTCALQLAIEVVVRLEGSSAVRVHEAALYEKLASRLTRGVFDAIVHLDHRCHFLKPAPKLASMLLRSQIGLFATDFHTLVSPEDMARFKSYIQSISPELDADQLPPIHIALLDASGSKCNVQIFVSACPADVETNELVYILGISEDQIEQAATSTVLPSYNVADGVLSADMCGIPEGVTIESDGEWERTSQESCSSGQLSQHALPTFELNVWSSSGLIVRCETTFKEFLRVDPTQTFLHEYFYDPSFLRAWIKMKALTLHSRIELPPRESSSSPLVLIRRGKRFDAVIRIRCVANAEDDKPVGEPFDSLLCSISVSILNSPKPKQRRNAPKKMQRGDVMISPCARVSTQPSDQTHGRSSFHSKGGVRVKGHIEIVVSAKELDDALVCMIDVVELMYKPLLAYDRWIEWMSWWNECQDLIADVPCSFANARSKYSCQIFIKGSDRFVIATRIAVDGSDKCFKTSWNVYANLKKVLPSDVVLEGRLELSASGAVLDSTLDGMESAARMLYKPFVGDGWEQWVQWWKGCRSSMTVVPCSFAQDPFTFVAKQKRSGVYTLSTCLVLDSKAPCFQVFGASGATALAVRAEEQMMSL